MTDTISMFLMLQILGEQDGEFLGGVSAAATATLPRVRQVWFNLWRERNQKNCVQDFCTVRSVIIQLTDVFVFFFIGHHIK